MVGGVIPPAIDANCANSRSWLAIIGFSFKQMSKLTPGWQKTSVLESVFDQLSDALVLYDSEFRITGVNRAAEKLFGMASEEMLGKHCQDIFKCSLCEPGCGVLVGINQAPAAPNTTVR